VYQYTLSYDSALGTTSRIFLPVARHMCDSYAPCTHTCVAVLSQREHILSKTTSLVTRKLPTIFHSTMNLKLHQRSFFVLLLVVVVVRVTPTAALATEPPSTVNKQRQPWEFGRFMRQSSKFVNLPFWPSSTTRAPATVIRPGTVVWQPSAGASAAVAVPPFSFGPLDDVVMGGASSSTFDNDSGLWKGSVTDANNGGFIGIRSFPAFKWDMTSCQGIELKLRQRGGDDQRFKIILRDSTDFNGICWTTSVNVRGNGGSIGGNSNSIPSYMKLFRPKDLTPNDRGDSTTTTTRTTMPSTTSTTTVRIPFDKQIPTLFAKTVAGATKFQKDSIVGVQLAYSKFEYDGAFNPRFAVGDIQLEIVEIKAY
jgi:Complex I intermediate-associated protein 30 (CIA30)